MNTRGQTMLEYTFIIGIVTLVLVYMGTDFKRGFQSVLKTTTDQLGQQVNSEQDFSLTSQAGFLTNSATQAWQSQKQIKNEWIGLRTKQEGEFAETFTNTTANQSFSY